MLKNIKRTAIPIAALPIKQKHMRNMCQELGLVSVGLKVLPDYDMISIRSLFGSDVWSPPGSADCDAEREPLLSFDGSSSQ